MADNSTNQNNPQTQKEFNDAINEYRSLLKSISSELGIQKTHVADANAEYRKMDSIAKQLQATQEGIGGLTSEQIQRLKTRYNISVEEVQNQAKMLLIDKQLTNLTASQLKNAVETLKLSQKEKALLEGYLEDFELEKAFSQTINTKLQERLQYEARIKDLTGATGAILGSMKGAMDKLGLSSLSNYLNIDAAKKAMQEEADAIARGEKEGSKLSVRMAGIKKLAEGLGESLFSTEAILTFVVLELAKGSQNMADFQKQTGMGYQSAYKMNMEMKGIALASGDSFITSEKLNKSYSMMTEQLGMSADILGGTALVSATNLSERLGMSAEAAGQLTVYSRLQGKNTEAVLDNASATVGAFNNQNKTAINVKTVLNDVAGASKSMYLNMGKNVVEMTKAAAGARALGLDLNTVGQIQEHMLDFSSSIESELQAQLLTGGKINMNKMREAALTGDSATMVKEIGKQEGIINAFRTKNVIAQKASADALGISKDQLAGMAMQSELNALGAENFKKQYGESAYSALKSRSASEKLGDALDKVKDILGSIVQIFSPILDALAFILDNPIAPIFIGAYVAFKLLSGAMKSFGMSFKGILGGAKDVATKAVDKAEASMAPQTPSAGGGMVESFSKINTTSLLKGAAAMLIAAGAIFVFGKSVQELEKVKDWGRVAIGLGLFAASMLILGAIGEIVGVGLDILAPGLIAFGAAVALMGLGLNLATPGIQAFGIVVAAAFAGLSTLVATIADSLVKLLGAVSMDNIGPMLLLGPALFGIAAGLGALGIAGLMALPAIGGLVALGAVAPAIATLATALGIGGGSVEESKSKADEGSLAAVEKKLDALITAVKQDKNLSVYLDGNKVDKGLHLSRSKTK